MKGWQFFIIAIFFVAFLLLGKIFESSEVVTEYGPIKSSTEASREISESDPHEEASPKGAPSHEKLMNQIKSVSVESIQTVFADIEKMMNEEKDPTVFLIGILQIENSKRANSYINVSKGYALDSFFHRLEEKNDFLPGPPVEEELRRLAEKEKHLDLAIESASRLKEHFGYDRERIIDLINHRHDRDEILQSLFESD